MCVMSGSRAAGWARMANSLWLGSLLLAALCLHATSETMGPAQLEPPVRVASCTPEPGDKYGNGSNRGTLWFPHAISTLPSGVLLLRVDVHPDALMPYNHATLSRASTAVGVGCRRALSAATPMCQRAHCSSLLLIVIISCSAQHSAGRWPYHRLLDHAVAKSYLR